MSTPIVVLSAFCLIGGIYETAMFFLNRADGP